MIKLLLFMCLFFVACAKPEYITVYKDVPVVTHAPCEVERPERPESSGNIAVKVNDLLLYLRQLEIALDFCR